MNSRGSTWLAVPAVVAAAAALPATAEVYLNESQALAAVFGESATVRREQKALDEATRAKLEHTSNLEFPETSYTFFIHDRDGRAGGYAIILNEIGKTEPITFLVGMSPEGKVTDVAIMVFRENRGWEVKEKRFLNQFRGKTLKNSIRINQDILNYTGATLSSKAVARGVKRALLLLDAFYPREVREHAHPTGQWVRPISVLPLAATADREGALGLYRQRRLRMGTIAEIRVCSRSSSEALRALRAGFEEIERIEQRFSAHRDSSELALVNREAGAGPVEVSEEFFDLTRYAVQSWERSGGAFDISVGPLMKIWGFRGGSPRMPSKTELLETRRLVGCDKLTLRRRSQTIQFQRPGMSLDFGGLAKGYAAQRAAHMARQQGAMAALVNVGGSSLCASKLSLGQPRPKSDAPAPFGEWAVGVTHPGDTTGCGLYLMLKPGWCLSTSGTYQQQFALGGVQLSHLIDPRSGYPLDGLHSLTTIAQCGRRSESLSKYLLALSSAERLGSVRRLKRSDWAYLGVRRPGQLLTHVVFHHTHQLVCLADGS